MYPHPSKRLAAPIALLTLLVPSGCSGVDAAEVPSTTTSATTTSATATTTTTTSTSTTTTTEPPVVAVTAEELSAFDAYGLCFAGIEIRPEEGEYEAVVYVPNEGEDGAFGDVDGDGIGDAYGIVSCHEPFGWQDNVKYHLVIVAAGRTALIARYDEQVPTSVTYVAEAAAFRVVGYSMGKYDPPAVFDEYRDQSEYHVSVRDGAISVVRVAHYDRFTNEPLDDEGEYVVDPNAPVEEWVGDFNGACNEVTFSEVGDIICLEWK